MELNAKYIFYQCVESGMTKEGACAILGNLQKESLLNPKNLEDTGNKKLGMTDEQYTSSVDNGSYPGFVRDGFAYGIAQWTFYTRKQMLLNYVISRGGSIGDLKLQTGFMIWELKSSYGKIWRLLCNSTDIRELTRILLYEWENPKEKIENMKQRYAFAQQWYKQFAKGGEIRMTQEEAIKTVLDLARSEIGYHEKASNYNLNDKTTNSGGANYTKYAEYLDSYAGFYNGPKQSFPWCDVFYDYLFVKTFGEKLGREMLCQPMNSAGAGCLYSSQYYKEHGRWVSSPQPGDQIFFSYRGGEVSHTGIVEWVTGSTVTTIEGNTSDQVARHAYSLSNSAIYGYGRPRWELAQNVVLDKPIVPETPTQQPDQSASAPKIYEVLRKGYSGESVREMQEKLISLGYDLGKYGADGEFGNDTLKAVKKFQKDYGLDVDGEAGPMTLTKLEQLTTKNTSKAVSKTQAKPAATVHAEKNTSTSTNVVQSTTSDKKDQVFGVGDIVNFTGKRHYLFANARNGSLCKPGKAKVTAVREKLRHPYHLIRVAGEGSTVWGWVDKGDIEAI